MGTLWAKYTVFVEGNSSSVPKYVQSISKLVHWVYYISAVHLYHTEGSTTAAVLKKVWDETAPLLPVIEGKGWCVDRNSCRGSPCRLYAECTAFRTYTLGYERWKCMSSSQNFEEEKHARCIWKCRKKQICTKPETGKEKPRMRHVCRKTGKYMEPVLT